MPVTAVHVRKIEMTRNDPNWRTSTYSAGSVTGFLLEVMADGRVGIGATAAHPHGTSSAELESLLAGPIRNALIGSDPLDGNEFREWMRFAGLPPRATIAADLALNDLVGKMATLPCHELWGGARRRELPVVRMVGLKSLPELEITVGSLLAEGFTHVKVKIGTGLNDDLDRIRSLRQTFGGALWIGVDANGAYAPEAAIELCHGLEAYDVRLIEQPVHPEDLDGLARVTSSSAIPIMVDQGVRDVPSALRACQAQAAHVISIKLLKMGTIEMAREVLCVCEEYGIVGHIGGSVAPRAVDAAQLQFASLSSSIAEECEVGEFLAVTGDPLSGLRVEGGRAFVSDAPGLGVTVGAPPL